MADANGARSGAAAHRCAQSITQHGIARSNARRPQAKATCTSAAPRPCHETSVAGLVPMPKAAGCIPTVAFGKAEDSAGRRGGPVGSPPFLRASWSPTRPRQAHLRSARARTHPRALHLWQGVTASHARAAGRRPGRAAVEVLRDTGAGWTRCISRQSDAVEVPHTFEFDRDDIALEIRYS
jgi:hypothetical protein